MRSPSTSSSTSGEPVGRVADGPSPGGASDRRGRDSSDSAAVILGSSAWTGMLRYRGILVSVHASRQPPAGPGGSAVRTPICDRFGIEFPIFAFSPLPRRRRRGQQGRRLRRARRAGVHARRARDRAQLDRRARRRQALRRRHRDAGQATSARAAATDASSAQPRGDDPAGAPRLRREAARPSTTCRRCPTTSRPAPSRRPGSASTRRARARSRCRSRTRA